MFQENSEMISGELQKSEETPKSMWEKVPHRQGTLAGCAEGQCFQDMRFVNVVQALRARPDVEQWVRGGMSAQELLEVAKLTEYRLRNTTSITWCAVQLPDSAGHSLHRNPMCVVLVYHDPDHNGSIEVQGETVSASLKHKRQHRLGIISRGAHVVAQALWEAV
eukprot:2358383-Pyramimonas_sp.AAC.4